MENIDTVAGVVEKLGGNQATMNLFGVAASTVSNWKKRGSFPGTIDFFTKMNGEASAKGFAVARSLFGKRAA